MFAKASHSVSLVQSMVHAVYDTVRIVYLARVHARCAVKLHTSPDLPSSIAIPRVTGHFSDYTQLQRTQTLYNILYCNTVPNNMYNNSIIIQIIYQCNYVPGVCLLLHMRCFTQSIEQNFRSNFEKGTTPARGRAHQLHIPALHEWEDQTNRATL